MGREAWQVKPLFHLVQWSLILLWKDQRGKRITNRKQIGWAVFSTPSDLFVYENTVLFMSVNISLCHMTDVQVFNAEKGVTTALRLTTMPLEY